mmetsp:Transcript_16070/g.30357  ORF Transcript_16070/g.30357 Transcript_16070/m.30357 type:complete len:712 (-) Transcript_16070:123-2258(-)
MNNDNDPSAIKGLTTGVAEGGGGGASSASQEDTSVNTSMASSSRFSIVSSSPQPPPRQPPLLQSNLNNSANANITISHDQSRRRRQRYSSSSSSSRQQQQLYHYQIRILLYTTFFSTILFLFFFLNLMAFLTFFFGLSSFTMLGYTLYSYLLFLQNDASDGILFRLLPSSLQDYLQYISPHEAMTGGDGMSSFLHDRWYWMYLIPGLTSEQINALVEQRLSDRQREMAYGPGGMARLFLPDQVYRLIAPPPVAAGASESGGGGVLVRRSDDSGDRRRQMRLIHGSDSTGAGRGTGSDSRRRRRRITRDNHERSMVMRITEDGRHGIPLPVIEERDDGDGSIINNDNGMDNDHDGPIIQLIDDDDDEEGEEQEQIVTMQDAFLGIVQNARNIIMSSNAPVDNTNNGITTAVTSIDTDEQQIQRHIMEEYNDLSWDDHDEDNGHRDHNQGIVHTHDSESETSDLGIDVSSNDFTGGMNDGQLGRLGWFLRLRLPAATSARITGMDTTSSSIRSHHTATESHDHDDLPPRVVTMITTVHHDGNNLNNHHRRQHPEQQSQQDQEQQDVSGEEIINQALSTMVDNYTNSAREAVTNAITDATVSFVESTTPTLIRAGNWMASFASAGLLGLYAASHVNVRSIGSGIGGGGSSSSISSSSRRLVGEGRTERYMETGLLSTMAMGVLTTGGAYLARWLTRRYMTGHRGALMDEKERKK